MKNLVWLSLLLVFLMTNLSAQKKAAVDLIFGVDYTNRTNTENSGFEFTDDNGNSLPTNSKIVGNPNVRFGMNFNHEVGKKIWLKTGVRYTRLGYSLVQDANQFSIFEDVEIKEKVNLSFIEIPLLLRYEFDNKKWSPFVEIGVASNYYIRSKLTSTFKSSSPTRNDKYTRTNKVESVHQWQFSGIVSLGYQYQLNDRFRLMIQPVFRYFLTENFDDEKIQIPPSFFTDYHNYSLGLEVGCRMMI